MATSKLSTTEIQGTNDYKIDRGDYIVQTNCDQCKTAPNILYSLERRMMVTDEINLKKNNFRSINELIDSITRFPVINEETIYLAIMSPKTGLHYSLTDHFGNHEILRF